MYMAPEILQNKISDWEKADVFALGVVFFSMLTGRAPFKRAHTGDKLYNLMQKDSAAYFGRL